MTAMHGTVPMPWGEYVCKAFSAAGDGKFEDALKYYQMADAQETGIVCCPELSLLRHRAGEAKGRIVAGPLTEAYINGFMLTPTLEHPDAWGMTKTAIDGEMLTANIDEFIRVYDGGYHRSNIHRDLPHVMVLSTGRCGTVSLFRLCERSQLVSYHNYIWTPSDTDRYEFMCRLISGMHDERAANQWAICRSAEWLGAISQDRPMAGFNHQDTVFAPVFASLHPESKFVLLQRSPLEVFYSYMSKSQWSTAQLQPLMYTFEGGRFQWRFTGEAFAHCIAWSILFIQTFCGALEAAISDSSRFMHVRSEDLFSQDVEVINDLAEFMGIDVPTGDCVEHFKSVYNEKPWKSELSEEQMAMPMRAFVKAYKGLGGVL